MDVDQVNAYVVSCIRRKRIEKGLRVQDVAERAGIPLGSYSCLETGRYRLKLENLFRVLAVLGLEVQEVWPVLKEKEPVERVTGSFVQKAVEEAKRNQPKRIGYGEILKRVCKTYGISRKQLCSPSRRRDLSEARAVATILVRNQPHLTLVGLSRLLKRDVSSLSHCLRRLEWRLKYDRGLSERIGQAVRRLAR